jgi:hypothetical protein
MFPLVGVDRAYAQRADELGRTIDDPVLARVLRERTDELLRMLDARGGVQVVGG